MTQRWTSALAKPNENGGFVGYDDYLYDIRKAVETEREACAKVCDAVLDESRNIAASVCAVRIRGRRKT